MFGSELVIRALARHGVRTIFSLSGNQIMPLYDACIDAGIRIVHVRHEAAAVFMADAWAQVTGEIGVAMVTAGPGVANAVGPLFSALHSESPVLLLSGDSALAEDGCGAFQELDQVAMTRPLTKSSQRATSLEGLVDLVEDAIATALAPRCGPVHLVLPFDLLTSKGSMATLPPRAQRHLPAIDDARVQSVSDLIAQAERPIILAGPTACRRGARERWQQIGMRLQAPVIPMESPRGLRDPALGAAAVEIARADLVVFAGKRLDFTTGFAQGPVFNARARMAVIDPDPAMIERAHRLLGARVACECVADPARFFEMLSGGKAPAPRPEWMQAVSQAVTARRAPVSAPSASIGSRELCEEVQRQLERAEDPVLVCDGGEFGQWAQAFCDARIRIINGMSGAIGGGICFAIAAKIARPNATVFVLMGDGTCGFHFMEFDTAVREAAPFVAVIGNDFRWNAEHQIQVRQYGDGRLIGCSLAATAHYHEAATALGGFGALVQHATGIEPALRAAAESQRPACVNVVIDSQPAPVFSQAAASIH